MVQPREVYDGRRESLEFKERGKVVKIASLEGQVMGCTGLHAALGALALGDDGDAQAAVRALQDELLVSPRADEVADALDQDEPADDHQAVGQPVAPRHARGGTTSCVAAAAARHVVRVEVVRVGVVGDAAVEVRVGVVVAAAGGVEGCGAEAEAELDEGDAEACARAVLRSVGGVQEVGEEEADELEGHGDDGVPDEAEEGAHRQALDEDFVAKHAGRQDGGLPIWRRCVGSGLFVRLQWSC